VLINPQYWVTDHRASVMRRNPLDSVDRLIEVPGVPAVAPSPQDWAAVESRLGSTVPADYKRFVDRAGAGQLAGIRISAPGASVPEYDLFDLVERVTAQAEAFRPTTQPPFNAPFHPQEGGLVPWGEMDGGFTFFWAPAGDDPDAWPVYVSDPSWLAWYEPYQSFSTFLAGYLDSPTGLVRGVKLPPAGAATFVPAGT
jgi:hypothetical protein